MNGSVMISHDYVTYEVVYEQWRLARRVLLVSVAPQSATTDWDEHESSFDRAPSWVSLSDHRGSNWFGLAIIDPLFL
jgi:hypothetical protein